jgi:hypothetical protein
MHILRKNSLGEANPQTQPFHRNTRGLVFTLRSLDKHHGWPSELPLKHRAWKSVTTSQLILAPSHCAFLLLPCYVTNIRSLELVGNLINAASAG